MTERPDHMSAFEFVVVCAMRTEQLIKGCTPRVAAAHRHTTTAREEVATGARRSDADAASRAAGRVGSSFTDRHRPRAANDAPGSFRSVVQCRLLHWGSRPALPVPLVRLGYTTPTPVQAAAIPPALQGRDVLARAQTGTGKTAAFGLPMIERLAAVDRRPRRGRAAWCSCPTRELALQVQESLRGFAQATRLRTMTLVGGEPIMPQVRTCAAASTSSSPRRAGSSITSTGGPSTCRRSRS